MIAYYHVDYLGPLVPAQQDLKQVLGFHPRPAECSSKEPVNGSQASSLEQLDDSFRLHSLTCVLPMKPSNFCYSIFINSY